MKTMRTLITAIATLLWIVPISLCQSTDATLMGRVVDPQKATVPDVSVEATNVDTNVTTTAKTNGEGLFSIPNLPPGNYRVSIVRDGFKSVVKAGIVLHVQDVVDLNFDLEIGSRSEVVTVNASGLNINTTDASVSTVIDRNFADTMPLNGRSFQSLILLAPGVASATPQDGAQISDRGDFSVNGQRGDTNNFTVDGVSANGMANPAGYNNSGTSGGLPPLTALGTTQALVSVDAMQEFKIQTSTYSAEYGRQPGAQISIGTRSGTNNWHGSAFDYFRNDVLDANDWFNDRATPTIPKPAERQNDFGGTLGGPLTIPGLYSGKDRTFFFFSYEGLRLDQPQPAGIMYVPSTQLRQDAPAALQPALKAFPLPNCTVAMDPQCVDNGNGLSPFVLNTSYPSDLDAVSLRIDEHVASWLSLFFRYGSTTSSAGTSVDIFNQALATSSNTFTLGADSPFTSNLLNQFRFNYSSGTAYSKYLSPTNGGAVPANLYELQGLPPNTGYTSVSLDFAGENTELANSTSGGKLRQWEAVDTLGWKEKNHFFRFGFDYRRIDSFGNSGSPEIEYTYSSAQSVLANLPSTYVGISTPQSPAFTTLGTFLEDEWRVSPSLSLALGLRWELSPPPTVTSGLPSRTVNGDFGNPSSLTLAPSGTALYHTTYDNFAPRLGVAWILRKTQGQETVFRGGAGIFYDTGQNTSLIFGAGHSPGLGTSMSYAEGTASAAFPLSPVLYNLPITTQPPYPTIVMASQNLQLPYDIQWNASLEQALGTRQSLTIGYLGSNGRRLIDYHLYSLHALNPSFGFIGRYQNDLTSNYDALQVQYKRTLSRGLQVLAAYTWSHALDYESQDDSIYPYQYGNSDFDVRHSFTAALSYDLPKQLGSRFASTLFGAWGSDVRLTARTGFPVTLDGNLTLDPTTGQLAFSGLDVVPGAPVYVYGPEYPGGRSINPGAFSLPVGDALGDAPRNFARGFGENEVNFAIRRDFALYEHLHLQFRVEAFNVFNHPNFGYVQSFYGSPTFGQAILTLSNSLGGLSPLYQQGGPRSLQFSLRLQF
jgi:hypothetical protein